MKQSPKKTRKLLIFTVFISIIMTVQGTVLAKIDDKKILRNPFLPTVPAPKVEKKEKPVKRQVERRSKSKPKPQIKKEAPRRPITSPSKVRQQWPSDNRRSQQSTNAVQKVVEFVKPDLKITGIIWNSEKPQAIVEGKIVKIGDNLKGLNIVNISKKGVEFEVGKNKFTIGVYNPSENSSFSKTKDRPKKNNVFGRSRNFSF